MLILNSPTLQERLKLLQDNIESLADSRTFINLTDELYLASIFGEKYVDAHGYDAINEETGEQSEYKTCGCRDGLNAAWTGLKTKSAADTLVLWDKPTGMVVRMPMEEAQFYINAGGKITARLTDNPPLEENQTRKPFGERILKMYQKFLSYEK